MASSGSFNTTAYSGRYLQFSWSVTSQSIANNTTNISWTVKGAGGDSTWYNTRNIKVTIAGETVYHFPQSEGKIQLKNGTVVASGTYTFVHNDDGTKSFTAYAEAGIYKYAVNCTGSATFTLDTIARASQPSLITYPENTQDVGEFGDTIRIYMNRKSSAFTHKVRYAFGSLTGTCVDADTGKAATAVTTDFKWEIPESFMSLIPNSTTGSGTIYVDTYNGSTLVGTKYSGFTAKVPDNIKPYVDGDLEDIMGIDDIYGSPVQGLSKIKVTMSVMTSYSSPIKQYSISIDGNKYSASTVTTGFLVKAGTSPVTITVTDGRGRSGSWSYNMTVQAYTPPKVTSLTVHRSTNMGAEDDQGEYVKVTWSAVVSRMDGKNTCEYVVKYKKSSETDWTSISQSIYTNSNYAPLATTMFPADGNSSYDVMVTATDRHGTASRSTSVSTAFTLFNCHPSGTGFRFGGVAEDENLLRSSLDAKFDKDVITLGNQYSFASDVSAETYGYVRMAEITIKGTDVFFPIVFELIRRGKNTPMKVSILFSSATTTKPSLQTIWYEGSNYHAYVSETSDSVWGFYVQKESPYDVITVSRWYTNEAMKDKVSVVFKGDWVSSVPLGLNGYYHATAAVLDSMKSYTKTTATLTSDFKAYGDKTANKPWYRNSPMGLVEIGGIISPTAADNAVGSHTIVPIFTLPTGCRPALEFYQLQQGSQQSIWQLSVGADGTVGASRYRNGSTLANPGTSAWMPFHATFIADQ